MMDIAEGQRWVSETEPELGLGICVCADNRRITIFYPATDVSREYSCESAPVRRIAFAAGDSILTRDDRRLVVDRVSSEEGIFIYECGDLFIPENELSDAQSFNSPEMRLVSGLWDSDSLFDLRVEALSQRHRANASGVRGFFGGRVGLVPHQLYIAGEVCSRRHPRVLLADEVGLGKTIEAGLILHNLILREQVGRVLILVPDALVYQWFVELLRRFRLSFCVIDENCVVDEELFNSGQFFISSVDFITGRPELARCAIDSQWDMVVVDEAHHLRSGSPGLELVTRLAGGSLGLLLLTASPEQAGIEGHFERLRLLDPHRFHDLGGFLEEYEKYSTMAETARKLLDGAELDDGDKKLLEKIPGGEGDISGKDLTGLLDRLLDLHGTGRVMFRNTRAAVEGFPKRVANLVKMDADEEIRSRNIREFNNDVGGLACDVDLRGDPRIDNLAKLIRKTKEKVLVICSSPSKVKAIESALKKVIVLKIALFHEGMSLLARDRNAAWFAEKDGADLLVCSEIGSEGRNFQFAHHLYLFDLPLDPELLEQRIGRLDRIGQTGDVIIHVPYIEGSPQEILARWYHEGMNAFEKNVVAGDRLVERFRDALVRVAQTGKHVSGLIEDTASFYSDLAASVSSGRDRLLEMNSCRKKKASEIIDRIDEKDRDTSLERFMLRVFDYFSVEVDERGGRTYGLFPGGHFNLPCMRPDGMTVTFDRGTAISREDIDFLSMDHPMVTGAVDIILGSDDGTSCVSVRPGREGEDFFLQAFFVLESVAPGGYDVGRYLPDAPLCIVVDRHGNRLDEKYAKEIIRRPERVASAIERKALLENFKGLVGTMINDAQEIAFDDAQDLKKRALERMELHIGNEIDRLNYLCKANPLVRPEEISSAVEERNMLREFISGSRLRLDSIRFIIASGNE